MLPLRCPFPSEGVPKASLQVLQLCFSLCSPKQLIEEFPRPEFVATLCRKQPALTNGQSTLRPEVSSIGEVSRFDVVLHVESPGETLENTFATAGYKRMLTTSSDLSNQVGAIPVLGRK